MKMGTFSQWVRFIEFGQYGEVVVNWDAVNNTVNIGGYERKCLRKVEGTTTKKALEKWKIEFTNS
jgi:hypothetical protein